MYPTSSLPYRIGNALHAMLTETRRSNTITVVDDAGEKQIFPVTYREDEHLGTVARVEHVPLEADIEVSVKENEPSFLHAEIHIAPNNIVHELIGNSAVYEN